MSNESTELVKPVSDTDLSPELRNKFHALLKEVFDFKMIIQGGEEEESVESLEMAADRLHHSIQEEVSAHPILARTIVKTDAQSLLKTLIDETLGECCKTIQLVIETNPHALLWSNGDPYTYHQGAPIYMIAEDTWHSVLLPWIVERFPWIFQSEMSQKVPPHLKMVHGIFNDMCTLENVEARKEFYELYPQGLGEKDEANRFGYPLSVTMLGWREPDAEIFIWMAERYPEAVHDILPGGCNMLHQACSLLTEKEDTRVPKTNKCCPDTAKICRHLISKYPHLIRHKDDDGFFPIHRLAHHCNRPLVQQIVVLLLKAHPVYVLEYPTLLSILFVRLVHLNILEELAIEEEIASLTHISHNLSEAAIMPSKHDSSSSAAAAHSAIESSLFGSLSEVYRSWANLRVTDLSTEKQRVQDWFALLGLFFEGDDDSDEDFEEDSSIGEDNDIGGRL
ncbi:hypothetical protein FisN_14Lh222 [Fistulifera solaris]|uniref:Uncharacterized protein n=1 Tax=Fistulifera solaris TaxID=1519565 RepID=A0A1Z5J9P7_FISSO|nr:hypothetical protein FisN_14Lh222 [Fistulifera solaris]|eukprot:GAX10705.1 hypothetical protein FisN_14Lh222 [Fistulifera solaris]